MSGRVKCYKPQRKRRSTVKLRTVPVQVKLGWKTLLGTAVGLGLVLFVSQKTALQQLNYRIAALEQLQSETRQKLRNTQLQYQQLSAFQPINRLATTHLGMISRNSQPIVITLGEEGHQLQRGLAATAVSPTLSLRE